MRGSHNSTHARQIPNNHCFVVVVQRIPNLLSNPLLLMRCNLMWRMVFVQVEGFEVSLSRTFFSNATCIISQLIAIVSECWHLMWADPILADASCQSPKILD